MFATSGSEVGESVLVPTAGAVARWTPFVTPQLNVPPPPGHPAEVSTKNFVFPSASTPDTIVAMTWSSPSEQWSVRCALRFGFGAPATTAWTNWYGPLSRV